MALPSCPLPQPTESSKVVWTADTETRLAALASKRAKALSTLAASYSSVDPVAQKISKVAQESQQYWETMVFESGNLAFLSPQKSQVAGEWLANWLGRKMGVVKEVREPLLNIKRQSDGMMREMGVYSMMGKQRELADLLRLEAKRVGDSVRPEDMRRALEEGLIPQRKAIYANSPEQERALMGSFQDYMQSMQSRGYSEQSIQEILNKAQDVSSQLDSFQAVQQATGMDIGTMYNVGMMPRQMTEDGFAIAKLAGAVDISSPEMALAAGAKSRSTWKYLPEDHTMAAQLLGVTPADLHGLIANPGDFAQFLSKTVNTRQLDKLVDSGVMSKIPMLTSDVNEYIARKYGLPLGTTDLFITDPLEATSVLTQKLKQRTERSAMVKLVETEGLSKGWTISKALQAQDPAQYAKFKPLNSIPELVSIAGDTLVHPMVYSQLKAIVDISKSPSELSTGSRMFQTFTSLFSKQALGNPILAKSYLTGQFLGNMISSYGGGASMLQYGTSVQDITKLAFKGLGEFSDVPKYLIDGVEVSERGLIAKTMRMFSGEILPGITGKDRLFKADFFDPRRAMEQVGKLHASTDSIPEFAGELGKMAMRTHDAALTPALRMASILDTASHLALIRQHARRLDGSGGSFLLTGVDAGRMDTWAQLADHVKAHIPVFDDMGKVPDFMARVFPFTGWAMQNLPIQMMDMVKNPSKWYNYARIHAQWNDNILGGDKVANGEMTPEDASKYGVVIRRDSTEKGTVILQTDQYDGKWGALGWLMNNLPGGEKGTETKDPIQRMFQQALSKSYAGPISKAITGMDPFTGRKVDDSAYTGTNQFMGITMPPWMSNVLSISPVLSSVDRLPAISGTKAVLDPRTGAELIPAVRNWLGGAGELPAERLNQVEQTVQILGGRVRYIDGVQNMRWREVDTEKGIGEMVKKIQAEQVNLADDVKKGRVALDSPSYTARLGSIHKMADASIQLNFDLARIQVWAIRNQIPSGKAMLEFKQRGLVMDNLPLPGGTYIKQALDDAEKLKNPTK